MIQFVETDSNLIEDIRKVVATKQEQYSSYGHTLKSVTVRSIAPIRFPLVIIEVDTYIAVLFVNSMNLRKAASELQKHEVLAPANHVDAVAMAALKKSYPSHTILTPVYSTMEDLTYRMDVALNGLISQTNSFNSLTLPSGASVVPSSSFNHNDSTISVSFDVTTKDALGNDITGNVGWSKLSATYLLSHVRVGNKYYRMISLQDNTAKTLMDLMFLIAFSPEAKSEYYLQSPIDLGVLIDAPKTIKTTQQVDTIFHGTIYGIDIKSFGPNGSINRIVSGSTVDQTFRTALTSLLSAEIGYNDANVKSGMFVASTTLGYGFLVDSKTTFPIENISPAQVRVMSKDQRLYDLYESGNFLSYMAFLTQTGTPNYVEGTTTRILMGGDFRPELRRAFSSGGFNVNQRQNDNISPFYQNVSADMFLSTQNSNGLGGNLTTNFIMQ